MKKSWPSQVTKTSTTLTDLAPSGWGSSGIREDTDGKRYRLFLNGTTLAGGESSNGTISAARVLEASTYNSTTGIASVIYYTTVTKDCVGGTIGAIPFAHYFWAQVGGVCTLKGTTTIDLPVVGAATDGYIADAAATDTLNAIGTSLATTSGADGPVLLTIG